MSVSCPEPKRQLLNTFERLSEGMNEAYTSSFIEKPVAEWMWFFRKEVEGLEVHAVGAGTPDQSRVIFCLSDERRVTAWP